jgi:hypothetical protein
MEVDIFYDMEPCSPYMNQRFGRTYHRHSQRRKSADQEQRLFTHCAMANIIYQLPAGKITIMHILGPYN